MTLAKFPDLVLNHLLSVMSSSSKINHVSRPQIEIPISSPVRSPTRQNWRNSLQVRPAPNSALALSHLLRVNPAAFALSLCLRTDKQCHSAHGHDSFLAQCFVAKSLPLYRYINLPYQVPPAFMQQGVDIHSTREASR